MKSTMDMAHGNIFRKSCMIPVIVMRNGKNVILMHSVAEKILFRKWLVASTALFHRVIPAARLLTYPSMITMESSTIIPRVMISAASVTVFSSRSKT